MTGLPALAVVVAIAAVVLGLPAALYALLTRNRWRTMREIRRSALREGWQFHRSVLRGDPTEFEVRGRTHSGIKWFMKCRGTSGYDRGWTVRLALRSPDLAAETDMAILPREHGPTDTWTLASQATPKVISEIEKFSGAAAGVVEFFRDASESPSGLPEFDKAYRVTAIKERFRMPLVDAGLAERMLEWPANSVKAHSMLAWRDPFGLYVEAQLPAPPNWATVRYFHETAEALIARVPPGKTPAGTHGIVDRLAEKFLRS